MVWHRVGDYVWHRVGWLCLWIFLVRAFLGLSLCYSVFFLKSLSHYFYHTIHISHPLGLHVNGVVGSYHYQLNIDLFMSPVSWLWGSLRLPESCAPSSLGKVIDKSLLDSYFKYYGILWLDVLSRYEYYWQYNSFLMHHAVVYCDLVGVRLGVHC